MEGQGDIMDHCNVGIPGRWLEQQEASMAARVAYQVLSSMIASMAQAYLAALEASMQVMATVGTPHCQHGLLVLREGSQCMAVPARLGHYQSHEIKQVVMAACRVEGPEGLQWWGMAQPPEVLLQRRRVSVACSMVQNQRHLANTDLTRKTSSVLPREQMQQVQQVHIQVVNKCMREVLLTGMEIHTAIAASRMKLKRRQMEA